MSKEYENRYWEISDDSQLTGKLHFTQYYDDEIILQFCQDKDDEDTFWYVSDLLNVEHDSIIADNPDDAMEQFEDMIEDHIQDQIYYYEVMLEKFKEEKV